MIDRSVDPAVHSISLRIAERCVEIVRPLLKGYGRKEVQSKLPEFYAACRAELDKPEPQEDEV